MNLHREQFTGGVKDRQLYGPTGPGVLDFWEAEQMLAAAKKRPVRECFRMKERKS